MRVETTGDQTIIAHFLTFSGGQRASAKFIKLQKAFQRN